MGAAVTQFKAGDLAGVGCMVDSCRDCDPCRRDLEQYCQKGAAFTYNGTEMDRKTPTYGGYSTRIVVDERFVLKVPGGPRPGGRGAAPLRRHHHLFAAAPVGLQGRRPRGRGGSRRPGPHGGEAGRLHGRGGDRAQHVPQARKRTRAAWARTSSPSPRTRRPSRSSPATSTSSSTPSRRRTTTTSTWACCKPRRHDGGRRRPARADAGARILPHLAGTKLWPARSSEASPRRRKCSTTAREHKIVSDIEVIPIQKINEAYERMLKRRRALPLRNRHREPVKGLSRRCCKPHA